MKVNILDAGIRHKSCHHFDHNLRLLKGLAQTGHDVHVRGYAGMNDNVAEARSNLSGIYRQIVRRRSAVRQRNGVARYAAALLSVAS